jgi:hypothetical protein
MGYNVDRESGEFAIADMRKAIRAIGETEGLRGLDVIAHSRGTDVLASVFQQLGVEAYFRRSSITDTLKIRKYRPVRPGYRRRRRRDENLRRVFRSRHALRRQGKPQRND